MLSLKQKQDEKQQGMLQMALQPIVNHTVEGYQIELHIVDRSLDLRLEKIINVGVAVAIVKQ